MLFCRDCANPCKYGYQYDCPNYKLKDVGKQTNEEWRQTCSAEEFAEFLADIVQDAVTYTGGGRLFTTKEDDIKYWIGWLKEKHK